MDVYIFQEGRIALEGCHYFKKNETKHRWYKCMLARELMCNILYCSLTCHLQGM